MERINKMKVFLAISNLLSHNFSICYEIFKTV
jgi:hypothetical protein